MTKTKLVRTTLLVALGLASLSVAATLNAPALPTSYTPYCPSGDVHVWCSDVYWMCIEPGRGLTRTLPYCSDYVLIGFNP